MLRMKAERIRRGWTQTDLAYHARVQPAEIFVSSAATRNPTRGRLSGWHRCLGSMRTSCST